MMSGMANKNEHKTKEKIICTKTMQDIHYSKKKNKKGYSNADRPGN